MRIATPFYHKSFLKDDSSVIIGGPLDKVFKDGHELLYCVYADDEKNEAVVFARDASGGFLLDKYYDHLYTTIKGDIEIKCYAT